MKRRSILRKTIQESVDELKTKLDTGHNFVDYFLTIGLDPEISLNPWLYEASIYELNTTYKEYLSPKIINKFPSFEKKLLGVEEAIINHIFPLGFQIIETINEPPKEQIFSIILDNNMYSIKYSVKFVTCLLFYEPLISYSKIYEKYNDNNIVFSSINNTSNNNLINISNLLDNNSNAHFTLNDNVSTISSNTLLTYGPISKNNSDIKNNIQPVFQGSNLRISDISQRETNFSSIINTNNININIKNKNLEKYYVPKCICLISLYPFITEYKKILMEIYKYSKKENVKIPLEKIINNLILEVPMPPRGLYSIEYNILETKLLLKNSRINSLFYISYEFELLFIKFNIEQVLIIFQYLMLGIKTIFFSSKIEYLTPIILSSLVLLFPFKFPFHVVTVLPKESYNLIDNVIPEVFGINEKYYPEFFKYNDISIDNHLLVVNIDEQNLKQLSPNINKKDKDKLSIPSLPKKIKNELIKKLKNYLSNIYKSLPFTTNEENKLFENTIRNYFLEFQLELLKNYPKYLNSNIYQHPSESPFNNKRFLKSVGSDDFKFYKKFIETQMFEDYIGKRMMPNDKREMIEVLFFEEKIFEMKEQKEKIMYINSNVFNFRNKPYQVNKVNPILNENILEFYSNEKNQKNLLINGIIIKNNNNIFELENKSLSFTYILFPKLNNDFFFKNEIKSYFFNSSLYEEIEVLNAELISKSHLSRVETPTNEITNYIYLLWLKVWANTFHYHDKKEHKYRYLQMMKVFQKINQHDMSILSHIFQALIKANANEDLIYHLYIKIIQSKLSPSLEIFNTVKTMITKKLKCSPSSNDIKTFLENKKEIFYTKEEIDINNFRERTMKNIYDYYTITERVTFVMEKECSNCGNRINIENFLKNLNDTNNDVIWAKCPFCKIEFFPKIKIIFGSEINKNNKLKTSTSIVDEVVLYSPKTLQVNILDYSSIDIDKYKLNYNPIFWNLIWYFKLIKLPYDFILPYSENIFRPKKSNNHKNNFFKVNFSNNDFINKNNTINKNDNNENNNQIKIKNINDNTNIIKQKEIPNNLKQNIPNNNQYNTKVHKIDNNNNQNKNIHMANRIIKLPTEKLNINTNNIINMNNNVNSINQHLSSVNTKQITPSNNNINIGNQYNIIIPNIAYNYRMLTPVNNYTPLKVMNPSLMQIPIQGLNNYSYNNNYNSYNQVNVIRTNHYSNYGIYKNLFYNSMNNRNINTVNNSDNLYRTIIYQKPIIYTSFISYNK